MMKQIGTYFRNNAFYSLYQQYFFFFVRKKCLRFLQHENFVTFLGEKVAHAQTRMVIFVMLRNNYLKFPV